MLKLTVAPTDEPVTAGEARAHCRIDSADENVVVSAMIARARAAAEHETQRCLVATTYEWYLDAWPSGTELLIPRPPLSSVTSVKYRDTNGTLQTLSSANYHVDTVSEPGRIWLADGQTWPNLQMQRPNVVVITFVAGYATAAAVPAAIKGWILLHVGAQYENRENMTVANGQSVQTMPFVDGLLDPYRIPRV